FPDHLVVGRGEGGEGGEPVRRAATHRLVRTASRREVIAMGAAALTAVGLRKVEAAADIESHGMSAFHDLKCPRDFQHFNYVDAKAPKGGAFSQIGPTRLNNQNFSTFNSLNSYILRGDAAQGMQLTFATLMVAAQDEPDSMYGLAAHAVRRSADGL